MSEGNGREEREKNVSRFSEKSRKSKNSRVNNSKTLSSIKSKERVFSIDEEEPRVHGSMKNGMTSISEPLSGMPNLVRRSEASTSKIDESVTRNDLPEATTSSTMQRSILREKIDATAVNLGPGRFFRMRKFFTINPPKRERKTIIFVDQRESKDSLESIVTLIGTSRPLKSALRCNDSLRSGNSSSVRFSIPPEVTAIHDETRETTIEIGKWKIVCEIANDENSDNLMGIIRSLNRTRLFKIIMCLTFGIIVPSFLIVPVLVYKDDTSNYGRAV